MMRLRTLHSGPSTSVTAPLTGAANEREPSTVLRASLEPPDLCDADIGRATRSPGNSRERVPEATSAALMGDGHVP